MKWRINFSIINSNYNLVGYAPSAFIANVPCKNGQQIFREWYIEHENGRTTSYVPVEVIDAVTDWILEKIIKEPAWVDDLHQTTEQLNRDYFTFAHSLVNKNWAALSAEEILADYNELRRLQITSHTRSIATTWFVDSNGEPFSNYLRARLVTWLEKKGITDKARAVKYFIILTTPTRLNFAQEEEKEFLQLLAKVQEDVLVRDFFQKKGIGDPTSLPEEIMTAVRNHFQKWRWIPYGYIGPAYELGHYLKELHQSSRSGIKAQELLARQAEQEENIHRELSEALAQLTLPTDLEILFRQAREIIWLKDYRKYCIFHGHWVLDMITKEIARRLAISHKQANYFLTEEVGPALLQGRFDIDQLNSRARYSVIWADAETQKIYYAQEAREQLKKLDMEILPAQEEGVFKGTCAYPGQVSGVVKIVNEVAEMEKLQPGEIMLALTTYPALLPAMRRAAAIVTEDGGITCHAAIVAREMRLPCVVGARLVTKKLQDGDRVSVDATEGIIKQIT
ncbi:MAG TPA: PEP-utilizing enzyme [Patescibacteria group bacterium]|nr:PEP-utilizing enzyme [Patescibacteria group bacterium]